MSSQNIRRRDIEREIEKYTDIERALEEYTGISNQQSLGVNQANVEFQQQALAHDDLHTRSNQLINQLYHDIARLERVKRDAVLIIQDIWVRSHEDYEELDAIAVDDYSRGILQEFVDTHGGD